MTFPPLVERELRAGARRTGFFWLRGLLAVAAGFQGYELLDRYALGPSSAGMGPPGAPGTLITGATLLHHMAWLLFLMTLLVGLASADSISRERRDGTLSLLLLTGLRPAQIVSGKMLSRGLMSFLILLGALPALMFPVLAGGVTGAEAAMTGIGLINTLFVSLAAGLWMSALLRERRHALLATMGLVVMLVFGPEILGSAIFGRNAAPALRLFELAGWITVAPLPYPLNLQFVLWFVAMQLLGWSFLYLAARTLATTWQDQAEKHFRQPEPSNDWSAPPARAENADSEASAGEADNPARAVSWLTDPRPWDADPIRWRVQRMGGVEGLVWLAVACAFLAQFGTLGSVFDKSAARSDAWGLLSFFGAAAVIFSSSLLAAAGARFFQDTRRQQDLELLLTTPIGSQNILKGQWRVLRRALAWPIGLVLLVGMPSGLAFLNDCSVGNREQAWYHLTPFLIAANVAAEALALCWVGIYLGLRSRNMASAVIGTVGLAQLLPLTLAIGLTLCWDSLASHSSSGAALRSAMPAVIPALLFFLAKNLSFLLWAWARLRRELRLGNRTDRQPARSHRLSLQPA